MKDLSAAPLTETGEIKAQKQMLKEMDKLKKPLDQCLATYQPLAQRGKGQEVRDYGPSRAKPILAGFQQFDQSLKPFCDGHEDPVPSHDQQCGKVPARLSGRRGDSWRARVNIVHTLWTDWAGAVLGEA